eukprot:366590_1
MFKVFDGVQYVAGIVVIVHYLVAGAVITGFIITLTQPKMFENRNRKLIIIILISALIQLLINSIRLLLQFFIYYDQDYESVMLSHSIIIPFLVKLFNLIISVSMILAYLSRAWLLLYQHKYHNVMSNKFWMVLLNKHVCFTNFWIKHINSFGNERYLLKRCAILSLIYPLTVSIVAQYLHSHHIHIWRRTRPVAITLIFFILFGMMTARKIWKKLPKEEDVYGIRDELQRVINSWVPLTLLCIIPVIFGMIKPEYNAACLCIIFFVCCILCYFLVYYSVFWVMKRYLIEQKKFKDIIDITHVPFTKLMGNIENYQKFMHFLNVRFAVSRFLFLTEYIQFKRSLVETEYFHNDAYFMINNKKITFELELPPTLPLSCFVIESNECNNDHFYRHIIQKMMGLVAKYLCLEATLAVNSFNDKVRSNLIQELCKEEHFINNPSHNCCKISKQYVIERCCQLLEQFEKAAYLVSLQLNRKFWVFCQLRKIQYVEKASGKITDAKKSYQSSHPSETSCTRNRSYSGSILQSISEI